MGKFIEAAFGRKLSKRLEEFARKVETESARSAGAAAERLADVEMDLALLAMIQVATMRILTEKGVMAESDLLPQLRVVDQMDGVEDGGLALDAFREIIEIPRANRLRAPAAGRAAKKASKRRPAAKKAAKGGGARSGQKRRGM